MRCRRGTPRLAANISRRFSLNSRSHPVLQVNVCGVAGCRDIDSAAHCLPSSLLLYLKVLTFCHFRVHSVSRQCAGHCFTVPTPLPHLLRRPSSHGIPSQQRRQRQQLLPPACCRSRPCPPPRPVLRHIPRSRLDLPTLPLRTKASLCNGQVQRAAPLSLL